MSAGNVDEELTPIDVDTLRRLRHDLRSPLLVITGFAQLLGGERDVSAEERQQYAERISAAAAELRALLDDAIG